MLDFLLFFIGLFASIIWFSVTIPPLLYGLPRSVVWASRGWISWRAPLVYLAAPVAWQLFFLGLAVAIALLLPSVASSLRSSGGFNLGAVLATAVMFARLLASRSARRDLQVDFYRFAARHSKLEGEPHLVAKLKEIGLEIPETP